LLVANTANSAGLRTSPGRPVQETEFQRVANRDVLNVARRKRPLPVALDSPSNTLFVPVARLRKRRRAPSLQGPTGVHSSRARASPRPWRSRQGRPKRPVGGRWDPSVDGSAPLARSVRRCVNGAVHQAVDRLTCLSNRVSRRPRCAWEQGPPRPSRPPAWTRPAQDGRPRCPHRQTGLHHHLPAGLVAASRSYSQRSG